MEEAQKHSIGDEHYAVIGRPPVEEMSKEDLQSELTLLSQGLGRPVADSERHMIGVRANNIKAELANRKE